MFEDSTFDSGNRIKSKSKYWMMFTFVTNGSILLVLILLPLIYPEALPKAMMQTLLVAPPPPQRVCRPNRLNQQAALLAGKDFGRHQADVVHVG